MAPLGLFNLRNCGFITFKRFRWHSTKFREPDFPKKRMLEVCKPIFEKPFLPEWETCTYNSVLPVPSAPHPYEKILSEELKSNWKSSRMICFFHVNPMSNREYIKVRNTFFKQDMFMHLYSEAVVKLALDDTPYRSCMHLYKAPTALLFVNEPRASELLKISKKLTHVVLLAAFIDDIFFSKKQIEDFSKLPNKEGLYQQLSSLLNSQLAGVSRTISQPQETLTHYLKQHSSPED